MRISDWVIGRMTDAGTYRCKGEGDERIEFSGDDTERGRQKHGVERYQYAITIYVYVA